MRDKTRVVVDQAGRQAGRQGGRGAHLRLVVALRGLLGLLREPLPLCDGAVQFRVRVAHLDCKEGVGVPGCERPPTHETHFQTGQRANNLRTSRLHTNNSKRSVRPGRERCVLARGDIISGWSMMNVGLMHVSSKKCPTSLSTRRATVRGGRHSTLCFLQIASKNAGISGASMRGNFSPVA